MTAAALLTDLTRRGIELVAHGDKLRFRLRSTMTPELVERVKAHKAELLTTLSGKAPATLPKATRADWLDIARRFEATARFVRETNPTASEAFPTNAPGAREVVRARTSDLVVDSVVFVLSGSKRKYSGGGLACPAEELVLSIGADGKVDAHHTP